MVHHCTFDRVSEIGRRACWSPAGRRFGVGAWRSRWRWYCETHAKALDALLLSGELGQAQRAPNRRARKALR